MKCERLSCHWMGEVNLYRVFGLPLLRACLGRAGSVLIRKSSGKENGLEKALWSKKMGLRFGGLPFVKKGKKGVESGRELDQSCRAASGGWATGGATKSKRGRRKHGWHPAAPEF